MINPPRPPAAVTFKKCTAGGECAPNGDTHEPLPLDKRIKNHSGMGEFDTYDG